MNSFKYCIILLIFVIFTPITSYAEREGTLTFSWTVDSEAVSTQKITELRVYQDSSDNMISSVDPLAGTVIVTTSIDNCSNFWATYATLTEESDRTDPAIKACEPKLGDPEPAHRVIEVGGFKLTIDFAPLN